MLGAGRGAWGSLKASLPHLLSTEYVSDCETVPSLTAVPPGTSSQTDVLWAGGSCSSGFGSHRGCVYLGKAIISVLRRPASL